MGTLVNAKGQRISNSWNSQHGGQLKCPVQGCTHTGDIITKLHCRTAHNMEREEVKKKYGMPIIVGVKAGFGGASNSNRWNSTSNNSGNLI